LQPGERDQTFLLEAVTAYRVLLGSAFRQPSSQIQKSAAASLAADYGVSYSAILTWVKAADAAATKSLRRVPRGDPTELQRLRDRVAELEEERAAAARRRCTVESRGSAGRWRTFPPATRRTRCVPRSIGGESTRGLPGPAMMI